MGVKCIMCTNDLQTNKHTSENFLYPKHTYILLYKAIGVTFKYPKPINNPLPDNGLLPGSVSTPDLRVGSELLTQCSPRVVVSTRLDTLYKTCFYILNITLNPRVLFHLYTVHLRLSLDQIYGSSPDQIHIQPRLNLVKMQTIELRSSQ